jgi:lysophospholipase L1-like esterase
MENKPLKDRGYAKVLLFIFSFFISLLIAEGALRIAGSFFNQQRQAQYSPYDEDSSYVRDYSYESFSTESSTETILCIGDSFTNAGNVKSYHSYPYNLYKLFNEEKKPKKVLNMGLCEDSTFGVHDRLTNFIEKYKGTDKFPSKVVVLIGAADKYERYEIEKDDKYEQEWFEVKDTNWKSNLRLYKVYRHIKLTIIHKYLSGDLPGASLVKSEEFELIKKNYLHFKKKLEETKDQTSLQGEVKETLKTLPQGFINYCNNLEIKFRNASELTHSLLVYMAKILTGQGRHDLALKWLLDLAVAQPVNFWSGEYGDAYFRLVQTYQIQSKYSEKQVLEILTKSQTSTPEIKSMKYYKEFYTLVKDSERIATYVDTKRLKAWDNMAKICKENNIKLFVVNYPSDYKSVNNILNAVVKKHQLPFLDSHRYFKSLIERDGRDVYLEDDDHLTPLGYKLLAKQIHQLIKSH